MPNAKCTSQSTGGSPFLSSTNNHLFEFFGFPLAFKYTSKTTGFALIFAITYSIRTIFHDLIRAAFHTTFLFSYHDSRFWVQGTKSHIKIQYQIINMNVTQPGTTHGNIQQVNMSTIKTTISKYIREY
jgi:hypothetical protein